MKDQKFTVTPWEVKGRVDYEKLIKQFGIQPLNDELIDRIKKHTKELHYLLRRRIFFAHRDLDWLLSEFERGNEFYLYTGRGPSGYTHLGHLIPWIFTKWLQDKFDAKLYFQVTDDEKFLFKEELDLDKVKSFAYDNILDIIALGFDPKKTFIFLDTEYSKTLYKEAIRVAKHITFSTTKAVFGFKNESNIGQIFFTSIQAVPAFLESVKQGRNVPCLIPLAADQDPHFRVARDVLPKLGYYKPAIIHSKFLPGLGPYGKMSASEPNTAIFTTDSPEVAKRKIMNAFSVDFDEPLLIKENEGIKLIRIGEFINEMIEKQKDVERIPEIDGEMVHLNGKYKVISFDDNFNVKFKSIEKVIRHKISELLFELELESGYRVKVTGSHSVFVIEDGKIVTKKVSDLEKNDYVVVPKRLPENKNRITEIDLVKELSKLPDRFKSKIFLIIGKNKKSLKDIEYERVPRDAKLKYYKSKLVFPIKIKIGKELLRFLGYYTAEGTCREDRVILSFGAYEKAIKDAIKIIRSVFKLGVGLSQHYFRGRLSSIQLQFGGNLLKIIIEHVLKAGKNAHNKRVPPLVFNVNKSLQKEYLKGYFCDGSLDKRAIIFKTVSGDLASDLKYLFAMHNTIVTIDTFSTKESVYRNNRMHGSKGFRIILSGKENIKKFLDIVPNMEKISRYLNAPEQHVVTPVSIPKNHSGFEKFYRSLLRGKHAKSYSGQLHISPSDLTKELKNLQRLNKKLIESKKELKERFMFLSKIAQGDLGFARVKHIKRVEPTTGYVYDVSVKDLENFVGGFGGVILHNTGQQPTVELQRKLGGNPDVCSVCQYYYFLFEQDDKKVQEIFEKERKGEILAGEHKQDLAERVAKFLIEHQKKREKAKDKVEEFMLRD